MDPTDAPTTLDEAAVTIQNTVLTIWTDFLQHLPFVAASVLILIITWIVSAIIKRLVTRLVAHWRRRESLRDLVVRLSMIGVWIIGVMVAAMVVFPGLTPSKALGAMGLASVAIGFAFKDIFENFFAGILILWRYPFEKGDFIECNDISGSVEGITIRMTMIRKTSGELVLLPNSYLFKNPVEVLTSTSRRRAMIETGIAYGEDVGNAVAVIESAVNSCDSVLTDKPVQVFPKAFGASSIDIEVAWWTGAKPVDIRRSRGEVVTAIKGALDDAGIEIPFPYRTLTFNDPIPVEVASSKQGKRQAVGIDN